VLGVAVIIERLVVYHRERLTRLQGIGEKVISILTAERSMEKAIAYLEGLGHNIGRIIARGLKMTTHGPERVEKTMEAQGQLQVALLENRMSILNAVGTVAPLLGFLGTVSGMIGAFQAIASAEQVSAQVVASGIYEALITTEYGLIVAIPVFFIANWLYHRHDRFSSELDRVCEEIINFSLTHSEAGDRENANA